MIIKGSLNNNYKINNVTLSGMLQMGALRGRERCRSPEIKNGTKEALL